MLHSYSRCFYVIIYKRKWIILSLFGFIHSPTSWKMWHSKQQLKFASPYVTCSVGGQVPISQHCMQHWSCYWNLAVQCSACMQCSGVIFSVRCDLRAHNLGTQMCHFKSGMFACTECVFELARSWLCIVKDWSVYRNLILGCYMWWCDNTEVVALRYEAIFALQYFSKSRRATRLLFTRYNREIFLYFSLFIRR